MDGGGSRAKTDRRAPIMTGDVSYAEAGSPSLIVSGASERAARRRIDHVKGDVVR